MTERKREREKERYRERGRDRNKDTERKKNRGRMKVDKGINRVFESFSICNLLAFFLSFVFALLISIYSMVGIFPVIEVAPLEKSQELRMVRECPNKATV